jgi:glucose-1-phosphate thymidylyltransferase
MSMEIAKAVVLAGACPGSAPWPSVGLTARQLAPVANRPVLFHHLDALARAGVRQVALVTDATTQSSIRDAVGDASEWGLELIHVDNAGDPNVLTSSVVADLVDAEPVLVHHGDVLMRECWSTLEADFAERDLDALILRPAPAERVAASEAAGYIIGPDIFSALHGHAAALDDVLQRLRGSGARVSVRQVDACMPCRGGAEQLLEANRRMLEQMAPGPRGERVFDSEVQGFVALHPSAEIRNSIVRGPVTIGPRARIRDTYVGPYTSIGAGVELECIEIEHSIVFAGAEMRYLSSRIEGSLIGPGARVTRGFQMPKALRLSIGEGAQISLAAG